MKCLVSTVLIRGFIVALTVQVTVANPMLKFQANLLSATADWLAENADEFGLRTEDIDRNEFESPRVGGMFYRSGFPGYFAKKLSLPGGQQLTIDRSTAVFACGELNIAYVSPRHDSQVQVGFFSPTRQYLNGVEGIGLVVSEQTPESVRILPRIVYEGGIIRNGIALDVPIAVTLDWTIWWDPHGGAASLGALRLQVNDETSTLEAETEDAAFKFEADTFGINVPEHTRPDSSGVEFYVADLLAALVPAENANLQLEILSVSPAESKLLVAGPPGNYRIETTSGLAVWSDVAAAKLDGSGFAKIRVDHGGPSQFFRVSASGAE